MEWIACSERLPEHQESVLICSVKHDFLGPSIGYYYQMTEGGYWSDEREQIGDEGWHEPKDVTHWMPLPPPPSPETR